MESGMIGTQVYNSHLLCSSTYFGRQEVTVIKTDRFDGQRNRLADLEAPTPATEQYEYWDAREMAEPRVIRISLRDVLATFGIVSLFIVPILGVMALGGN
jgi:hypothetical protein